MRLTAIGWVVVGLFAGWASLAFFVGYADWKLRLEQKQRLELRDWQEKVEAMKRMQDREGDA